MTSVGDGLPASIRTVKDKSNGKLEIVFKIFDTSKGSIYKSEQSLSSTEPNIPSYILSPFLSTFSTNISPFSSPLQLGMHSIDLIFYLEYSYFNMLTFFFYFGPLVIVGEKDSYLCLKVNH